MNTVILILTSAIVIAGQIARADSFVEVTRSEGRDLLNRGKARIPADAELADAGYDFALIRSGTIESALHPDIAAHMADRGEQLAEREASEAAQEAADAAPAVAATDAQTEPAAPPEALAKASKGKAGK